MASLNAQQKEIAIRAILHMEGTDGSNTREGPTIPEWGGKGSALSYGRLQNDISQGENEYDTTSNNDALFKMLDNYNGSPNLDEHILASASTSAGADAIVFGTGHTDVEYNNIISSALSAPENIPIWQAQDKADEHIVLDRLTEALNYINDKSPEGAGMLSWSELDPESLMALAAWTNQHQNIMPMIETLTAGASAEHKLSRDDLFNAIFEQGYFQGPKAYPSKLWKERIGDTVSYVNAHHRSMPVDQTPPSAAKPREPAFQKPTSRHTASMWDMHDFDDDFLTRLTGLPWLAVPPDSNAQLLPRGTQPHEQMSDIAEAMRETERREAARREADGADTGWMMGRMRGLPNEADIIFALAAAIHQAGVAIADARPQPVPQNLPPMPTGRPDDPLFIRGDLFPNAIGEA